MVTYKTFELKIDTEIDLSLYKNINHIGILNLLPTNLAILFTINGQEEKNIIIIPPQENWELGMQDDSHLGISFETIEIDPYDSVDFEIDDTTICGICYISNIEEE